MHGIRDADVADAPKFIEIMDELIAFVRDSSLVIHNAPFDLAFLNMELSLAGWPRPLQGLCEIIDTLLLARSLHPGKRNNLDALCDRYAVDTASRSDAHGALIDANLLAEVYLAMTSGQSKIEFSKQKHLASGSAAFLALARQSSCKPLPVVQAGLDEIRLHEGRMRDIHKKHLANLSAKSAALRNEVRSLSEQLAVQEVMSEKPTSNPVDPAQKETRSGKIRDALSSKRIELDEADAELCKTREEGARLLRPPVAIDSSIARS